jgi:hypothetical protein
MHGLADTPFLLQNLVLPIGPQNAVAATTIMGYLD